MEHDLPPRKRAMLITSAAVRPKRLPEPLARLARKGHLSWPATGIPTSIPGELIRSGRRSVAMPKKGKAAIRSRHLSTRRKRRGERRQREDWIQYALTAAQLASSIAAWIEAIRH